MISSLAWLVFLSFFSGLSVNLILQCGLGMAGFAGFQERKLPLIKIGLGFVSVMLLWFFFSYIIPPMAMGFFGYMLLFPAPALVNAGLEYLLFVIILKRGVEREESGFFYDGLAGAALFVTLTLANSFMDAVALGFGFASGIALTLLILGEIRRRAAMEAVPRFLRGSPLTIVSMGLLSLVSGAVAVILFGALGG
ncbi:MAG TPA: hypothetical protein DEQ14_03195 [Treponema sp.]|nr:hypothetical protein [Treponema sp.]